MLWQWLGTLQEQHPSLHTTGIIPWDKAGDVFLANPES